MYLIWLVGVFEKERGFEARMALEEEARKKFMKRLAKRQKALVSCVCRQKQTPAQLCEIKM